MIGVWLFLACIGYFSVGMLVAAVNIDLEDDFVTFLARHPTSLPGVTRRDTRVLVTILWPGLIVATLILAVPGFLTECCRTIRDLARTLWAGARWLGRAR